MTHRRVRLAGHVVTGLAVALAIGGCFWFRGVRVEEVPIRDVTSVDAAVKAHLIDGSSIVYKDGITIAGDTVHGEGVRYDLTLGYFLARPVPLDSVLAMESFHTTARVGESIAVSLLATGAAIAGGIAIACAADPKCFGSCPTVYSDSAGTAVLEAEGFSYSIAPLFEMRDVDRLRATADHAGLVRLEVRNEALETHYINHVELLEVLHGSDEWAVPEPGGRPLALRRLGPAVRATDRAGRDVLAALAAHDGAVFRSDSALLDRVTPDDLEDYVDLELPAPDGADSVALVFRGRNSLLATVLLYDLMLGDRGAKALDWLETDLQEIGTAVELGEWALEHLGMRVAVWDGHRYQHVARIPDTGPVAWKDAAVVIPILATPLRVRLSFLADNWRIDRIAVAGTWRRIAPRIIPLARVIDSDGRTDTTALASLAAADLRYLQTTASQRFFAEFETGLAHDTSRTFFLAAQGYYIEWIRRGWITAARDTTAFRPSRSALYEAIARWRLSQDSTERAFHATRVPVR